MLKRTICCTVALCFLLAFNTSAMERTTDDILNVESINCSLIEPSSIPSDVVELMADAEALSLYSEEEINLIALVALGEAEGESELGKRLVIDTILNRVDHEVFPNSIEAVCYQQGQFACLHNGRCNRCSVNDYILELVKEELLNRTNTEVLYFSSAGYNGPKSLFQEGHHYFSGR